MHTAGGSPADPERAESVRARAMTLEQMALAGRRPTAWDRIFLRFLRIQQSTPPAWRYALAIIIVAAATALRWALIPWLGTMAPYNIALVAMVTTTLVLGIGPGVLSVLLASVAVEVFITRSLPTMLGGVTLARLGASMAIGGFASWVLHAISVAQARAWRSEAALRESEGKYRTLFEMLPVTVVIHQDRRVVLANPASLAIFRTPDVGSVTGGDITQYFAEEARERIEERLRAGKRGEPEAPDHYFTTLRRADGEELPAEVFSADTVYQGRRATQTVVLDITEQVRMQEALRQSEARLRALFAAMNDVILVLDADGRCLEIAPTKLDLLYRPPEELLGKTAHEIFPSEQADSFVAHIREALASGATVQMEHSLSIAGEERAMVATISPLSADTVLMMARDVTAMAEQRARLVAAERARADLAEHLTEEIDHRARNNLAMVSGLLQMQALQEPNPEVGARLREAVARMRNFADIYHRVYAAGAEEANLLEVIQQVAATVRTALSATAAEVSVEGASGLLPTRAVTNLAVLTNELITNALKHGGVDAGRAVQVKVQVSRAEGQVRISVWNSGPPVPAGFDAAAQRGMGLRLVTTFAAQYGGSFRMRPAEGGTVAELAVEEAALDS